MAGALRGPSFPTLLEVGKWPLCYRLLMFPHLYRYWESGKERERRREKDRELRRREKGWNMVAKTLVIMRLICYISCNILSKVVSWIHIFHLMHCMPLVKWGDDAYSPFLLQVAVCKPHPVLVCLLHPPPPPKKKGPSLH